MGDHITNSEGCITHGPWGGLMGKNWIYKPNGFIRKITIVHGRFIHGIKFNSGGSNTGETESSHFGGKNGEKTDEICIDYPNEYLTSISGMVVNSGVVDVLVTSLCFGTNQNQYGPYGLIKGRTSFSFKVEGVMIAGFYGCYSENFLKSIGIYVIPKSFALDLNSTSADTSMHEGTETNYEGCIALGPWGGSEGEAWVCMPKGIIKRITIVHGKFTIDCIKFESEGCTAKTERFFFGDCQYITQTDTICIDYPNEYLTSISGTFYKCEGSVIVNSLCFGTNQKRYGPYCTRFSSRTGTHFSYDGKGGVIVGFHGRGHPDGLNAIGIYVMPESLAFGRIYTTEQNSMHETCCSCISRMIMPREAGPWGAFVGKQWDDGVFSTVKQVHVFMEESLKVLCAIQFVYVKRDAKLFLSSMHGGVCGDKMELVSVVNLDVADEYLTGISGCFGPVEGYNGLKVIKSITFHTHKRKHGPYGEESGIGYTYFTSTQEISLGKVVGFYGRKWNGLLTAIGFHMEYF